MKAAVFLLLLPLAVLGSEINRGDTYLEVRTALGEPRGQLESGNWRKLIYDRGVVELEGGVVTKVALRSPAAQAELEARRAAQAEVERAEFTARQARLAEEGMALKARKLADPNFLASPVAYQLAFWEDFARLYPGVPVAEELTIARMRVAEHEEERRARAEESRRIAELEDRVREAEERAERAEAAAATRYAHYPFGFYGGRGRGKPVNFLPEYHWNVNVQPPYSTPSGNPAGRMDGAPYTTPSGNPAGRMDGAPYVTPSASPLLPQNQATRSGGPATEPSYTTRRRG
ncbi:MAG TPA: hypothetical protein VEB66_12835 [Opitutaceae bacterium]|nr:hypothetical protein [Opitutaceae bacterium]